jgi:DNA mismatch endonuclease (patch repair protein)
MTFTTLAVSSKCTDTHHPRLRTRHLLRGLPRAMCFEVSDDGSVTSFLLLAPRPMIDVVSKLVRSRMMSGIRGRDTSPERALRRQLFAYGLRFRLHRGDLPGRPDLVLAKHRAAVFVHGCFWHRHAGCRFSTVPATNAPFWQEKFRANVARDRRNQQSLLDTGWRVAIVWECALDARSVDSTTRTLARWISGESQMCELPPPSRSE